MDGLNHKRNILYVAVSVILAAALLAGLCLPMLGRERMAPEDPLSSEIRDIHITNLGGAGGGDFGEHGQAVSGTPAGSEGAQQGGSAGQQGGDRPRPSDPPVQPTEKPEEPEPEPSRPPEGGSAEPQPTGQPEPDPNEPSQGDEEHTDDNVGDEGDRGTDLDLGLVLTWYKYGAEAKTVICAPEGAVKRTVLVSQLIDDQLQYKLSFTGEERDYAEIIGVTFGIRNSTGQPVGTSGQVTMIYGQREYAFEVTALVQTPAMEQPQETSFLVVIGYESGMDLELALTWQKDGVIPSAVVCAANGTAARTVKSTQLDNGLFRYDLTLMGSSAEDAVLLWAEYVTDDGQSGTVRPRGSFPMQADPETGKRIYYITAAAEVDAVGSDGEKERTVVYYTFVLTYEDDLDLSLEFTWYKQGTLAQELTCAANERVTASIKRNQLVAGALTYDLALSGESASRAKILSAHWQADSGERGTLAVPSGSLSMTVPEGAVSQRYTLSVAAQVTEGDSVELVEFTVVLTYASDLTLELSYTVQEESGRRTYTVSCENRKSRQADPVYDDQLEEDSLPYTLKLVGEAASGARITSVTLYRSGDGKTQTLEASGSAQLMLDGGKTGENTFTVTAEDDDGNGYTFIVNIPYKHKGNETVIIDTNLADGDEITNDTPFILTVEAWSEDSEGKVVSRIHGTGADTKLQVWLDGQLFTTTEYSGYKQQYTLVAANPEEGDTNEHLITVYAEDEYGNSATKEIRLTGRRSEKGQVKGTAQIYIDMTVIGLGVIGPINYEVLNEEPVSYVVAKAVWGYDAGDPFGAAEESFGWSTGRYSGTLDIGFYLRGLSDGSAMAERAQALSGLGWSDLGDSREEILAAIDAHFGRGSGLATLWRCIYLNGITLAPVSDGYTIGEFDFTGGSGWMYSIGGGDFYPGKSMSEYWLEDGDILTLRYSLAHGWDVGNGQKNNGYAVGYCVSAMNGSFTVNHTFERQEREDGSVKYVCPHCGLEEDCRHETTVCRDREDGTCALFCEECKQYVSDPQEHQWQYAADEGADTHTRTCANCQLAETEEHLWTEVSNTATCVEPGIRTSQCADCGAVREEASESAGHKTDNTTYKNERSHWQKCQVCQQEIEGSRSDHEFVYDPGWEDWLCAGCGMLHEWDGCGSDYLTVSEESDCRTLIHECGLCGLKLKTYGSFEDYHRYENGVCAVCGAPEPGGGQEPAPEPTPAPEDEQEKRKKKTDGGNSNE